MDNPELEIPLNLVISKGRIPRSKKEKDKLSSATVKFTPVSVSYLIKFWKDLEAGNIANEVALFQLKEGKDGVAAGTTGSCNIKLKESQTFSLYIPYRANGEPLVVSRDDVVEKERGKWTTQDVVEFVILPLTTPKQKCMVDVIDKKYVGKPFQGAFVSQARSCRFQELVNSISSYFENKIVEAIPEGTLVAVDKNGNIMTFDSPTSKEKTKPKLDEEYVWLDIFSANQPHLCNLHPDAAIQKKRYDNLTFGLHEAIRKFDLRLIFFDSFKQPTPFTRAWCIWELYGICLSEMSLEIICTEKTQSELESLFLQGGLDIITMISSLNLKDIKCFNEADLNMITSAVEKLPGGFSELKIAVGDTMRKWVMMFAETLRRNRMDQLMKKMDAVKATSIDDVYEERDVLILFHIGNLLQNFGEDALCEKYLTEAVKVYEAAKLNGSISATWTFLPYVWNILSGVYLKTEKPDLAVSMYQKLEQYYMETITQEGLREQTLASVYAGLGAAYLMGNQVELASQTFDKALELARKSYGEHNILVIGILTNKALVQKRLQQYVEALGSLETCLDLALRYYGENHPDTAAIYTNLASVCLQLNKFDDAIAYSKHSLEINLAIYGEWNVRTARVYGTIALCYARCGLYNESKVFSDGCCKIFKQCMPESAEAADRLFDLGIVESNLNLVKEAEAHFREAKTVYQSLPGNNNAQLVMCDEELNRLRAVKENKKGLFKKLL